MGDDRNNMARLGWAVAAFLAIVLAGVVVTTTMDRPSAPPAEDAALADNQLADTTPVPAIPVPLAPLDRAQLLQAATAAADAVAAGLALPEQNTALVGRTFVIRLPFGCGGPDGEDSGEWAYWSRNPKSGALKLVAKPHIWDEPDWVRALAGELRFDAVEGFWIRRPWTSSERCAPALQPAPETADAGAESDADEAPEVAEPPPPVPVESQTVGIAQFFAPEGRRTLRRGTRPYSATVKARPGTPPTKPQGYRLVLSGRITGYPDGQPVHCWNRGAGIRPVCLVAVEFSRVAFEDPADGSIISEWVS